MRVPAAVLMILLTHLVAVTSPGITNSISPNITSSGRKRFKSRGIRWWNLAQTQQTMSDDFLRPETSFYLTPSLKPLSRKQRRLVTTNPGTITAIARSARVAVRECQYQFRNRRWNCPTADTSHGSSIYGRILRKGCRETAFIYAITSSALSHSIARSCSEGSVFTCSCGKRVYKRGAERSRDWEWGGCSDNTAFGRKFARDFIDRVERGRDLRCKMNLHNNEAGRLHVSQREKQECKCHGMSGSCALKTCWMKLPPFRVIGDSLKDRFDGASQVLQDNSGKRRITLIPTDRNHKPPGSRDLVYYEPSPTFCDRDSTISFRGTRSRPCNASSLGVDGCDLMCCGRGYRTEVYTAKGRCNCIFHWCCEVTCETCTKTKVRHMCL